MPKTIELKVAYHPSGNRTLMERLQGENMFHDLKGQLFTNRNEGKFYRAVARAIAKRSQAGFIVKYKDVAS